jgi:hypothetical protein
MAAAIASAAVKALSSFGRRFGLFNVADNWAARAAVCELCPLRVVQCGISYCGKPYLRQMDRTPSVDGCGCPCREKARSPGEHCPLDRFHRPAVNAGGGCTCKWCSIRR